VERHGGSHIGRRRPDGRAPIRARAPRVRDAGIARAAGLLVAAVTAGGVFFIGLQLFPVRPKHAPPAPPPAVPAAPPVALPPPPAVSDASSAAADASSATAKAAADAGAAASAPAAEKEKPAAPEKATAAEPEDKKEPTEDSAPSASKATTAADKQRQADKDLAREAWRRNRPDVSVSGNKAALLIPIRGSIKGADFKIVDKRRTVVVTLPKAVSMVTMKVYNLKHPSFRRIWIDQDEANAQPEDGTKLRVTLSQTLDPQVEITDDFVRVTVRRLEGPTEHSDSRREEPAADSAGSEKTDE